MNGLNVIDFHGKEVIDSREVAEMVEKQHKNLLRDITGYIKVMGEANQSTLGLAGNGLKIEPVDFFILSSYIDNKGEYRPCYLITKKGCDMIANKLTGEKGVLFTAAYVTAFEEMRTKGTICRPPEVSPNGLARLISITRRIMLDTGDSPQAVKAVAKTIFDAWCIPIAPEFSKQVPGQFSLFGYPALEG